MEVTAGNAIIKRLLLVYLCIIKNSTQNMTVPYPSVSYLLTRVTTLLNKFPTSYQHYKASTLAHTRALHTTKSKSFHWHKS